MGAAYSKDLRERVLGYIEEGHTRQAAADLFKVQREPHLPVAAPEKGRAKSGGKGEGFQAAQAGP